MNKILKSGMMLAMALLAMSCNKEELPGNGEEVNGGVLTINVVDKGYASQDSVPETKATTDGSYKTTFGEGDEIGVYVVSSLEGNQILLNNEKLTYSSSGWTGDLRYKKIEGDSPKFFAYYPYDGSISAEKITASAEKAEGFFATYLTNIELPTDQSDAGKYSKADIMVGDGVLAGTALTFGMKHQMGLVVIEIPKKFTTGTLYYLEGDESFTWEGSDYTESEVSEPQFTGVTPLAVTPASEEKYLYRYLVNPVASAKSAIQGSFSVGGSSKSYTIETTSFPTEGGKYKTYSVGLGAGAVSKVKYTPKVGDFYMNDGRVLSTLPDEEKGNCIGIVFSTTTDRIGSAEKSALSTKGVSTPHGLVMALTDASTSAQWKTSNDGDHVTAECTTRDNCKADISGLKNYNEVKNADSDFSAFPAFAAAETYNTTVNVSSLKTTGWFLPSIGQWWDILANLGNSDFSKSNGSITGNIDWSGQASSAAGSIDVYLNKVGSSYVDLIGWSGSSSQLFWTSSEYVSRSARYVVFGSNGYLSLVYSGKGNNCRVRCVLAF